MDVASTARSLMSLKSGMLGSQMTMAMVKQTAESDRMVVGLVQQAVDSAKAVAAAPAGTGRVLDVTV